MMETCRASKEQEKGTSDAVSELKLRRGDDAMAIIKSTEVMIAKEAAAPVMPSRLARRLGRKK